MMAGDFTMAHDSSLQMVRVAFSCYQTNAYTLKDVLDLSILPALNDGSFTVSIVTDQGMTALLMNVTSLEDKANGMRGV